MYKLIALFMCLGLFGLLHAADDDWDLDSDPDGYPMSLVAVAPSSTGLNLKRMWENGGIGLKLKLNWRDAKKSRISWSIRVPNEPALKVLGDGYYFIPARAIFQHPSIDETSGRHYVDIILEGKRPGVLFDNCAAAAINIGQNHLQIMTRLQFMDNGDMTNTIHPEAGTPLFVNSYLATETFTGKQVIQLHLPQYKAAYRLYKQFYERQNLPLPVKEVPGEEVPEEDQVDGTLTPSPSMDTSALGLMTEFSVAGQAAMQVPVYEYDQSPIGF